jgi:hypothetical protein
MLCRASFEEVVVELVARAGSGSPHHESGSQSRSLGQRGPASEGPQAELHGGVRPPTGAPPLADPLAVPLRSESREGPLVLAVATRAFHRRDRGSDFGASLRLPAGTSPGT